MNLSSCSRAARSAGRLALLSTFFYGALAFGANPVPSISALSPQYKLPGSAGFTLTVTGSQFVSGARLLWNGVARSTHFVSATKLTASIPATDLVAEGTAIVYVSNPSPGGGRSAAAFYRVEPKPGTSKNPVPKLSPSSPSSFLLAPMQDRFTLISGSNFVPGSVVYLDGVPTPTQYSSASMLLVYITLNHSGTLTIQVKNPAPGGGASSIVDVAVHNSVPVLTSFTPASLPSGGTSTSTLTVKGSKFVPGAKAYLNGHALTTTYVSATQLKASVPASLTGTPKTALLKVTNPTPDGGTSAQLMLPVGYTVSVFTQAANDIVWDAKAKLLYFSVPDGAAAGADSIGVLDPVSGALSFDTAAGVNPDRLAISDDDSLLYVGYDGDGTHTPEVQRLSLPDRASDIEIPLSGGYFALGMQVAPGAPHTTAISLGQMGSDPQAMGGIVIYDDATPRTTTSPGWAHSSNDYSSIQWGADATILYASNTEDTGADLYTLAVDADGVTQTSDQPNVLSAFGDSLHFDATSGDLFTDTGEIYDPVFGPDGSIVGSYFPSSSSNGVMVPDSSTGNAYFAVTGITDHGFEVMQLDTFGLLGTFPINSIQIPGLTTSSAFKILRWGKNGLVMLTGTEIVVVRGSFVTQK